MDEAVKMDQGDEEGSELSVAEIAQLLENMNNRVAELEVMKMSLHCVIVHDWCVCLLSFDGRNFSIACPLARIYL